jgi:nitrite reductase/ring-hydroxylating ferredoxin subunit
MSKEKNVEGERKNLFFAKNIFNSRRKVKVYLTRCPHCNAQQQTFFLKDAKCSFCGKKYDLKDYKIVNGINGV